MQRVVKVGSASDGSSTGHPRRPGRVSRAKSRLMKLFSRQTTPTLVVMGPARISSAPVTPAIISYPTVSGAQAAGAIAAGLGNMNRILIPGPMSTIDITVTPPSVQTPIPTHGTSVSLNQPENIASPPPRPSSVRGSAFTVNPPSSTSPASIAKPGGAAPAAPGNTVLGNPVSAPTPNIATNTLLR